MGLFAGVINLLHSPTLLVLVGVFLVVAVAIIPLYFHAYKPKRGTTEWIQRLDPVRFERVERSPFRGIDAVWAILAALVGALLRVLYCFLLFRIPQQENALEIVKAMLPDLLRIAGLAGGLALLLYLLLHAMFQRTFPALCLAALSGLVLRTQAAASALLVASLLCFYIWMSQPKDARLWLRGLWLLLAGGFYTLSLLPCSKLLWLAPFYVITFGVTLYFRFREEEPEVRGKHLLVSILATCGFGLLAAVGLFVTFGALRGFLSYYGLKLFVMGEYYNLVLSSVKACLSALIHSSKNLLSHIYVEDCFITLLGMAALVPLLHGVICRRDSRTLFLLGLLAATLPILLLSGLFYLSLPLLLILGWTWSMFTNRGYSAYVCIFTGVTAAFYFAVNLLR